MSTLIIYILIGFLAQMIDGSLGMAYGVSCRSFLRTIAKLPAPIASAVIHVAEIPTSLVSGLAHYRIGNVDRNLLVKLIVPGIIGGIVGAWFLSGVGEKLEVPINLYLILMGIVILYRAIKGRTMGPESDNFIYPLGLAGGFLDAVGGGGWGPIVTSSMIASGENAKKTIGTVNAAEFLVTIAETTTFAIFIKDFTSYGLVIVGLIIGGVIAAPIAAKICKRIPEKPLMISVGILIVVLNIYNLMATLSK